MSEHLYFPAIPAASATSAAFTVDTVPPTITITLPDSHRLVDEDVILVSGEVLDGTSGVAAVSVSAEGGDVPVDVRAGVWTAVVPLEVGRNTVTVTAVDNAGLSASRSLTVIRLVTDRGEADVERMRDLFRRGYSRWTEAERAWWANTRCRRGSYDDLDLNRVRMAMAYLNGWLRQYGYLAPGYRAEETVWTEDGQMTRSPGAQYIANVAAFRAALPVPEDTPRPPVSLRGGDFDHRRANDIERILVAVDAVRPKLDMSLWYCGEIYCGEF